MLLIFLSVKLTGHAIVGKIKVFAADTEKGVGDGNPFRTLSRCLSDNNPLLLEGEKPLCC
jgi:hypothetical protein